MFIIREHYIARGKGKFIERKVRAWRVGTYQFACKVSSVDAYVTEEGIVRTNFNDWTKPSSQPSRYNDILLIADRIQQIARAAGIDTQSGP